MRIVILGFLILIAVPEYAAAQRRERPERPERSATGRTAQPREEAVQAAPARRSDRRPEPREETPTRREYPSLRRVSGAVPGQEANHYRARYRRAHSGPNVVFVPFAAPTVVEREVVVERHVVDEVVPARLILDIYPPTAQVFADGYYIGIPEDFRFESGGAALDPGPHRIDIMAHDHEQVSFDVNLTRGQSATFRQVLTPIVRAPQPAPDTGVLLPTVAAQPTTFYLIPGCYMGNVPPEDANLPATCDIARALSFQY